MLRCQKTFDFSPEDIFLTLCDGTRRNEYDPDIDITRNES